VFEGPLDLLLHLIDKNKIDIYDIPIVEITNQYMEYIRNMHREDYVEGYKEWGADVILSGHLHGGIVRIPGIGGVITPQAFLFPKYSGEMTVEGEQAVIVSKGLGTHTIDIRLFNTPEVVLLTLKKPL
ncbi:MAG: hypothetical protein U0N43_08465, partial [Mediterraneibacter sp.]